MSCFDIPGDLYSCVGYLSSAAVAQGKNQVQAFVGSGSFHRIPQLIQWPAREIIKPADGSDSDTVSVKIVNIALYEAFQKGHYEDDLGFWSLPVS